MKKMLFLLAACTLLSSCATLLSGRNQTVTFQSPQQATVYLNNIKAGETNQPIRISRQRLNNLVTVHKDGYQDYQYEMVVKMNPVFWVNIAFGLFVTGYFDLAYDGHQKVDKAQTIPELKPLNGKNQ